MNYSLTIVACLFCSFVFSQNTPQLIVNATGHTGKVRGLNFISENELVSISEDKSIRWWDVRSGKELARKYLNSESGADGKLFSMSYNEQNGLIAVGGYTTREISEITIIDAAKKQFNVQLQAFTGPVHALKFSGDGTLLVAGSITGELAVWEINPLNEFKLRSKINIGYQISDIDISPDNASVVVAGNSEVIQCFNTTDLNSSYTFERHFLPANTVSYTQDGEYVISGGQDLFVLLFESTGKFIKKIGKLNHEITDLSISDDSRVLTVLSKNTGEALSYSIPEGDLLTTFQDHNNTAYSSDFHPNSGAGNYTIASSGGHGNEILLWNAVNGALINTLEGGNGAIQQLSIDKTGNLLIATEADENQFQFNFNFKDFVVTNTTEIRSESVSKYRKQPTPYIYKMGKNTIANDAWRDGRILSSKELSKDSILIGSDYSLRLYEGNTAIKEFIGHQGGVRSIVVTDKYYISGGEDEVIHFWRRNEISESTLPYASLFIEDINSWVFWTSEGYFTSNGGGSSQFGWLLNTKGDFAQEYYGDQFFQLLYQPERISEAYNMGISVNELLELSGQRTFELTKVQRLAAAYFDAPYALEADGQAFRLTQKGANYESAQNKVTLPTKVFDGGSGIASLSIYQNTKLIHFNEEFDINKSSFERNFEVNLLPGTNEFKIVVSNLQGVQSRPSTVLINYTGKATAAANLYVLNVGINQYLNTSYNLNYAFKDASAFLEQVKQSSGNIFENIYFHSIYNEEATKEGILNKFEEIAKKASLQDVFMFYYAGHGTVNVDNDSDNYYLVPTNVTQLYGDKEILDEKGISSAELKSLLASISAQKQVILLDACHSGGASEFLARRGSPEEKAIVQLARSAGTVVLAASGSQQFALEFKQLGHGVFTYTLLEGLRGKADGGEKDGKITVNELKAYMEDQVPAISEKYGSSAQFPTGFSSGQDFPIAIYK